MIIDLSNLTVIHTGDDPVLDDHLLSVLMQRKEIENRAKYKVGEYVKLTSNYVEIMNSLMPTYNRIDAKGIAKTLCGETVKVISVDELTDNGVHGTYYTIEDADGLMWCFAEKMFV